MSPRRFIRTRTLKRPRFYATGASYHELSIPDSAKRALKALADLGVGIYPKPIRTPSSGA